MNDVILCGYKLFVLAEFLSSSARHVRCADPRCVKYTCCGGSERDVLRVGGSSTQRATRKSPTTAKNLQCITTTNETQSRWRQLTKQYRRKPGAKRHSMRTSCEHPQTCPTKKWRGGGVTWWVFVVGGRVVGVVPCGAYVVREGLCFYWSRVSECLGIGHCICVTLFGWSLLWHLS